MTKKISNEKLKKAKELLENFNNNEGNKFLIDKYLSETFFDIIRKSRSETVHSNFLRWYFEQDVWNECAIKKLLSVAKNNDKSNLFPKDLSSDEFDKSRISNIKVEGEHDYSCVVKNCGKKQKGYVDIVISCDLKIDNKTFPIKIIIENKVYSPDHDHQTYLYYTYFSNENSKCSEHNFEFEPYKNKCKYSKHKDNEKLIFLYLSPTGEPTCKKDSCICKNFIQISYQDLNDKIFRDNAEGSERQQFFLNEYRYTLIKPCVDEKNIIRIMATDKEDTEKFQKFWETYLPLFKLAGQLVKDASDDKEEEKMIETILGEIDSLTKKHQIYTLTLPNGSTQKGKMRSIATTIVDYLISDGTPTDTLRKLLPKGIKLIDSNEYNKKKRKTKYKKKFIKRWDKFKKIDSYLSARWTEQLFNEFLDQLKKKYPNIIIDTD